MARELKENGSHLHEGEQEAQRRFGVDGFDWSENKLEAMFHDTISAERAAFFESLPFFFIATANAGGECDCSFRGREHDTRGRPFPLVNGHIGMLFIDFQAQRRVRLNGLAVIIDDASRYTDIWPGASQCIRVIAQQVYGNCRARIPQMTFVMQA